MMVIRMAPELLKWLDRKGERDHVVRVADGEPRFLIEEVGQCGLSAFDLRGKQGLLADRAVQQPVYRRYQP